jgi:DNA-binding IclR family transcriptional regulator
MSSGSGPTERVVAILDYLANNPDDSFSLSQIARRLELNKATVQSVLRTLVARGYVIRRDMTYTLGPAVVVLGQSASGPNRLISFARQEMLSVAKETGLECIITVVAGDELILLDTSAETTSRWPRVPLTLPFGAHFVAWEPEDRINKWLSSMNATSASSLQSHRDSLAIIRKLRYSVVVPVDLARLREELLAAGGSAHIASVQDRIGEIVDRYTGQDHYVAGAIAADRSFLLSLIHAPVFGPEGNVTLALSITGFEERVAGSEIHRLGKYLVEVADRITAAVGGRIPIEGGH